MATSTMSFQEESVRAVLAEHTRHESERREALRRVQADYREMPGLSVTLPQACRLWSLSPQVCSAILHQMVDSGQLELRAGRYTLTRGRAPQVIS